MAFICVECEFGVGFAQHVRDSLISILDLMCLQCDPVKSSIQHVEQAKMALSEHLAVYLLGMQFFFRTTPKFDQWQINWLTYFFE